MNQEIVRIDLVGVNCYLCKTRSGFVLFDTGGHMVMDKQFSNRRDILEKELDKAGCGSSNLQLIVLTHGDYDHAGNAAYIRDKYNAKIAMHPADRKLVENPGIDDFMNSFRYKLLIYRAVFRIMRKTIYKVSLQTLADFDKFTPDIFIDDRFCLSDYGFDAEILHLPGHTAGSIVILTKDGELIAGDTFANFQKPDIAPNAVDFGLLKASLGKLRSYQIQTVYPGHGSPFQYESLSIRK